MSVGWLIWYICLHIQHNLRKEVLHLMLCAAMFIWGCSLNSEELRRLPPRYYSGINENIMSRAVRISQPKRENWKDCHKHGNDQMQKYQIQNIWQRTNKNIVVGKTVITKTLSVLCNLYTGSWVVSRRSG